MYIKERDRLIVVEIHNFLTPVDVAGSLQTPSEQILNHTIQKCGKKKYRLVCLLSEQKHFPLYKHGS